MAQLEDAPGGAGEHEQRAQEAQRTAGVQPDHGSKGGIQHGVGGNLGLAGDVQEDHRVPKDTSSRTADTLGHTGPI